MRTAITSMTQHDAPGELVDYLHAIREHERVALARKIHDELGGLLVSAAMDLGWVEAHSPATEIVVRLRRIGTSLAGAIAIKRDMIEQLRPTLLDNFGLFEALRWYFKHACSRADVVCKEVFPPVEVPLMPDALSNVFRAAQTLLDCTFLEERLRSVDMEATVNRDFLSLRIGHQHAGPEIVDVLEDFRNELQSTAHRMRACGGELSFDRHDQGLDFYVHVPLIEVQG
jgi:signal transduction histidine kinase